MSGLAFLGLLAVEALVVLGAMELWERHERRQLRRTAPWSVDIEQDIAQAVDLANGGWNELDELQLRRELRELRELREHPTTN